MRKWVWLILATASAQAQSIADLTVMIQKAPTAALLLERGNAYLEAGDAKLAIGDFDRALERDAVNGKALSDRARAEILLGKYDAAITDLSGAIALSPSNAELYLARSDAYSAAGDTRRATEDREEAQRLAPDSYSEWTLRSHDATLIAAVTPVPVTTAVSAPNTGQKPGSSAASSAKPEPRPPAAKQDQTKTAAKSDSRTEAAKSEPAPGKDAESADNHYARGRDLLYKDQFSQGMAEMNRAIAMEPNNAVLYNTRGFGYYRLKDYRHAIEDFEHALRLDANYLNAVHNLGLAYRNAGDQNAYNRAHQREMDLAKKLGVKAQ